MPLARFSEREDASLVAGELVRLAESSYHKLANNKDAERCAARRKKGVYDLGYLGIRVTPRCGRDRPKVVLKDPRLFLTSTQHAASYPSRANAITHCGVYVRMYMQQLACCMPR